MIKMDILDKIFFRLAARKVPVIQVKDVEEGRVRSVILDDWVENPNTLFEAWKVIGAEKKDGVKQVEVINRGVSKLTHITYKGETVELYIKPMAEVPDRSKVVGTLLAIDVFGELLDLGKSMRNTAIGFIIGCLFWASIGNPILTGFLS
jgi:hypothetical protein